MSTLREPHLDLCIKEKRLNARAEVAPQHGKMLGGLRECVNVTLHKGPAVNFASWSSTSLQTDLSGNAFSAWMSDYAGIRARVKLQLGEYRHKSILVRSRPMLPPPARLMGLSLARGSGFPVSAVRDGDVLPIRRLRASVPHKSPRCDVTGQPTGHPTVRPSKTFR
jgi:hypothetical protein